MSQAAPYQNDNEAGRVDDLPEAPTGQVMDDSYKTDKKEAVPVVGDDEPVEDPINEKQADSAKALERDEEEAMNKSNIIKDRLRGDRPEPGSLKEPDDNELGLTQ